MPRAKRIWVLMIIAWLLASNSAQAAPLVDENFDDDSYTDTGWDAWMQYIGLTGDTPVKLTSDAAYRGAYGVDLHYFVGANHGDLHQDNNTSLVRKFSPGMNHYFVRGYFQFPFSTSVLCAQPIVQRKLIYFKSPNFNWNFIINAWPWAQCETDGYNVSVAYVTTDGAFATAWGNGSPGFFPANNHIRAGIWYYIETEVLYGTYGNDTLRIWLGAAGTTPSLIFERTDMALRSMTDIANGAGLDMLEIGRQVDIDRTSLSQQVDEHRYWDEIVIDTARVGPIGDVLSPDAGGGVDSGNDGSTPVPESGVSPESGSATDSGIAHADAGAGTESAIDSGPAADTRPGSPPSDTSGCACSLSRDAGNAGALAGSVAGMLAGCILMLRRRRPREATQGDHGNGPIR